MPLRSELTLRGRAATRDDLDECRGLIPPWLPLSDLVYDSLFSIWSKLLDTPGFSADLIEDLSLPKGQQIVGLGMTIALNAEWQQRIRVDPPPFVAARLYEALLDGSFVPLSDRELGEMNANGDVSFMVLHYHQKLSNLNEPNALQILVIAISLYRAAHAGFRLRELYQESVGAHGAYLLNMGFRLRTHCNGLTLEPPQLFGLNREEAALLLPGTPVRDSFQCCSPILIFSAAERRLLRLALTDVTEDQAAEQLALTAHSIKKLWSSIYRRAGARMPRMFGTWVVSGLSSSRGPEKRRALLQYLRQHPEELRPYRPQKPPAAMQRRQKN